MGLIQSVNHNLLFSVFKNVLIFFPIIIIEHPSMVNNKSFSGMQGDELVDDP